MGVIALPFILIIGISHLGTGIADRTKEIQATLYSVIHDLALPGFNGHGNITERFILLVPGEVLDYYDYCPLQDLTVGEDENLDPYRLPPDENAFRLGDTVPTLNPLSGGTTGKHLSVIYENILFLINTSYAQSDPIASPLYASAMDFLKTEVHDPENVAGANVSRFELYYRYKTQYYHIKERVSEWLASNKTNRNLHSYEIWYHEHYESLTEYVSAAYSRWLISGEKDAVEDKIAVIDVKSIRQVVEEARQVLRQTKEPSLDGGTYYYPTHFIPSDWYRHLLASKSQLTWSQIDAKINNLKQRKQQLNFMISYVPDKDQLESIEGRFNKTITAAELKMKNNSHKYYCFRYFCQQNRAHNRSRTSLMTELEMVNEQSSECDSYTTDREKPCSQLHELQITLDKSREAVIKATDERDSAIRHLTAYSGSNMNSIIDNLNLQIKQLEAEQKTAPKAVPPDAVGNGKLTQKERDENWMSFNFDSESSVKTVDKSSKTYRAAASFSASSWLWSASGGASYSQSSNKFASDMNEANISISGKFLRVTINRNWFRPSIFTLAEMPLDQGVPKVSPGPMSDEFTYVKEAESYQLPEYTTAFLLAKDISLRFRGLHSSTISHTVESSASAQFSGSYGPFSASASYSQGHHSSHLKVSSLSDGLHIDIPGAQIIGYYTSVLPKFPIAKI